MMPEKRRVLERPRGGEQVPGFVKLQLIDREIGSVHQNIRRRGREGLGAAKGIFRFRKFLLFRERQAQRVQPRRLVYPAGQGAARQSLGFGKTVLEAIQVRQIAASLPLRGVKGEAAFIAQDRGLALMGVFLR